ncbi:hypothetical protein [Streptomyces sp. NRRL F-2799]|uniref:hypothetical protein n=1 Tax=Streptomyces sp. NRRL F-2799 TaxID=1463844 RepID=UPI0018FEB41A|nr:hypothetical protein [Streptomyces sp. NRRL F-2799]
MAILGDPLMYLGSALAYWVQADDDRIAQAIRPQPSHLPGMLTRTEIVERYGDRMGMPVDNWPFYEAPRTVPARRDRPVDPLPLPPQADPQHGLPSSPARRELPRSPLPRGHPPQRRGN